jgi:hypothetical protein
MADMPTPALFEASTQPIVILLSATDRCSSQVVIAMQPAVPLWKVIVGLAPTKLCNRTRKGPVFSFIRRCVEGITIVGFAPGLALGHLSREMRMGTPHRKTPRANRCSVRMKENAGAQKIPERKLTLAAARCTWQNKRRASGQ